MSGTITTPVMCCGWECREDGGPIGGLGLHWGVPVGTPTLVTAAGTRGPGYVLRIASSGAAQNLPFLIESGHRTLAIRFYYTHRTVASGTGQVMQVNTATNFFALQCRTGNAIRQVVGATLGANSAALTVGQEYLIDWKVDCTATTWTCTWSIDGASQYTSTLTSQTAGDILDFAVGNNQAITVGYDIDDLVVSSTLTDYPIGAGKVWYFPVASVGTHSASNIANDFLNDAGTNIATGGETTSWQKLDEVPAVYTSDHVKQAAIRTAGYLEYLYDFTGRIPRAVEQIIWVANVGTTGANQKGQLYDGTTATDTMALQAAGTVAGTIRTFTKQWASPPSGGSWTAAKFALLRLRWGFSDNVTHNPALVASGLEVEFSQSVASTLAGTVTSSGALPKRVNKPLAGTATSAGALVRSVAFHLAGTVTSAGALAKRVNRTITGAVASAGALTNELTAIIEDLAAAGAIALAGALTSRISHTFSGTATSTGALSKRINHTFTGTVTSAGALVKRIVRTLTGTITSSGALATLQATVRVFTGTLTSAGALTKRASHTFTGTVTSAGALVKGLAHAFAGTLTSAGALKRRANVRLVGTITSAGAAIHWIVTFATFTGTLASAGALQKRISHTFAGTLTLAGAMSKALTQTFAGTVDAAGAVAYRVNLAFSGVIAPIGTLARGFAAAFAGVLSMSGAVSFANVVFAGLGPVIRMARSAVPLIRRVVIPRPRR